MIGYNMAFSREAGCVLLIAVFSVLVLGSGCTGTGTVKPSGFLADYKRLRPDPEIEGVKWWAKPGVDWKKYTKILIDPVQIKISLEKSEYEIERKEMNEMGVRLRRACIQALKERYPVVERGAPGALRIRAALTHLKPVRTEVNVISTAVLMWPMDFGGAAVEAQFLDASGNTLLAEIWAAASGSPLEIHKVWNRWEQVEAAFEYWARLIRESLDQAQALK